MSENKSLVVGVFPGHAEAESAIKELQKLGFDMKKLSVIGRGYHSEEHVVGYYNVGDRMASWGKTGLFWGWVWGALFGSAFFFIPGIGPVVVGGPFITWFLGALETAVVVAGVSALGGALVGLGIPKDSVLVYETALKNDKFMLLLQGTHEEAQKAKQILMQQHAEHTDLHDSFAIVN